jgi:hypothetical protein
MHALFIKKSSNRKTGQIPTTYTERKSCPPSCPHYKDDCYAEDFYTRLAWNRAPDGLEWGALCHRVASLPEEQIWRHNVGGDLPGDGEKVDAAKLGELVKANIGRRGFTYTHKKSPEAIKWIRHANEWGFTVNLSADDAGEADLLAETNAGPVVCIVPINTPTRSSTPKGRPIVVCPAQERDTTCEACQLCQRRDRAVIVGFRAHGTRAAKTEARARRVIPIARAA